MRVECLGVDEVDMRVFLLYQYKPPDRFALRFAGPMLSGRRA